MHNLNGHVIKGYRLYEQLGSGGFGAVYRATQEDVQRDVAIKFIRPEYANRPDFIRRFEVEVQIIALMEHPHIVPLYDYWRDPQGAFLVMRYMRGGSLRDLLREQHTCDIRCAARIMAQISGALHYVHQQNVIHRDVKPSNILLDESGIAYLADFGIAKRLSETESLTNRDVIVGSVDYISPEQARGEQTSPGTDVYSLGVVLYEMLTGDHPFPGISSSERLYKHLHEPVPPITSLPAAINDSVNAVIQRATAKAPERRYPNILSFAQSFSDAVQISLKVKQSPLDTLTEREVDIARLIVNGLTNHEIASELIIEHSTVRWYIRQINKKLNVFSRTQLKRKIAEMGWFQEETPTEDAGAVVIWEEVDNPYKGLRAFERSEANDFFGREAFVSQLAERLDEQHPYQRFLAIIGPSGSGKSSVAKAGLIPALTQDAIPGSAHWFILDMLPGSNPYDALETALTRVAAEQAPNLYEHLHRDERGLIRAADLILPEDVSELVLLIDQFEELFTLVDDEDVRRRFLDMLIATVKAPHSRVRVIVTLRADFFDRPLQYPAFGEILRARMETLLPLSAKEIERAIIGPVEQLGMMFDDGLVAQMVAETTNRVGALPLLQFTLTSLFAAREESRLTQAAYHKLGGVGGALAQRAEEVYAALDAEMQAATRQIFLRLVTLGEGAEDTRRRVPYRELKSLSLDEALVEDLLELFAQERFLSLDRNPATREPIVEVAHEALLRQWERVRAWINESRTELRLQRQFSALANEWQQRGRSADYLVRGGRLRQYEEWASETELLLTPLEQEFLAASIRDRWEREAAEQARQRREVELEQQAGRFLRALTVLLFFVALGGIGVSAFAFDQQQQTQRERDRARELALVNGARVALVSDDLDTAIALAFTANQSPSPSPAAQTVLSEAAYAPGTVRRFGPEPNWAFSIDISPDGQTALSGGMEDNSVILWDVNTGNRIFTMYGHDAPVRTVGINPDGTMGYSIAQDLTIILWDLRSGEMLRRFGEGMILGEHFLGARFTPDGEALLSNNGGIPPNFPDQEANLILWDVHTGEPLRIFRGHERLIGRLAISQDGTRVLSCGFGDEIILWDMATGEIIRRREEMNPADFRISTDIVFLPDGQHALILFMDSTAEMIDLNTLETVRTYGENVIRGFAFAEFAVSPDYETLYLNNWAQQDIALWDIATGRRLQAFPTLRGTVGASFSPDGETLLVSADVIRQIAVQNGAVMQSLVFESTRTSWSYSVSRDGETLLVNVGLEDDCEYILYDIPSNMEIRRFATDTSPLNEIGCAQHRPFTFLPDGASVLSAASEGPGILWDVTTGEILLRLPDFPTQAFTGDESKRIAVHPGGQSAITPDDDGTALLQWDLSSGSIIQRIPLNAENEVLYWVALSPDDNTAVTVLPSRINCWNLQSGASTCELRPTDGVFRQAFFHPDGQQLVTSIEGSASGSSVSVWNLATEESTLTFATNQHTAGGMDITPDGRYALFGFPHISVWDLTTGEEIRRYPFELLASGGPLPMPDNQSFFVKAFPESGISLLYRLRIDTHDELLQWTRENRYIREPNCTEREIYSIAPLCSGDNPSTQQ